VHALLPHLEEVGFPGVPRVVGTGFDAEEQKMLSYVEGEFVHPGPWTLDGAVSVGVLLRQLHKATASCCASSDAVWYQMAHDALRKSLDSDQVGVLVRACMLRLDGRPI
jgi:hypothetical protein